MGTVIIAYAIFWGGPLFIVCSTPKHSSNYEGPYVISTSCEGLFWEPWLFTVHKSGHAQVAV